MGLTCFKAYDIRGKLGEELNEDVVYRIGRAYAQFLITIDAGSVSRKRKVVVGGDVRLTSEQLKLSLSDGLRDSGVDVIDIGLCGTEEIYFATSHLGVDGGIVVTASHNPIDYNGMKLVREGSKPISGDTGLNDIKQWAEENNFSPLPDSQKGGYTQQNILEAYIQHLLTYVDVSKLKPLKLVMNAGNGAAGHVVDAIEKFLPFEIIKIHNEPDGTFPNGIPNPILHENRADTANAVIEHKADMGIAWDGDFDRCFFFDAKGQFIEGYYVVGLLADAFLAKNVGAKVVHDPRLIWNTQALCQEAGGHAVQSKTGHAFIKERMRKEDAVYGGEMSAHHYFRDFAYCDSGMIPWLLVAELLSVKGQSLSAMLEQRIAKYPSPGEINSKIADANAAIQRVLKVYENDAINIDRTDGISLEFDTWRFNLRMSNTEPVVRLNLETKNDQALMEEKTQELLALIRQ